MNWQDIKHFKSREFDSPDQPGSGQYMNEYLIKTLDKIRDEYGYPIKVTSGYRTPEHNARVGGEPNSEHMRGMAVDIEAPTSQARYALKRLAYKFGIQRIGNGKDFIHLGVSVSLPQNVEWNY